jgi:hypothetical protein
MFSPEQKPGCLPEGFGLDSMLTPEQFATWQQAPIIAVRRRLIGGMPGAIKESRKCFRIHPRTYLSAKLGGQFNSLPN